MKTLKHLIFIFGVLLSTPLRAESLYQVSFCSGPKKIIAQNLTAADQAIWTRFLGKNGYDEIRFVLKPWQKLILSQEVLPAAEFSIKTTTPLLTITTSCDGNLVSWNQNPSPLRKWIVTPGSKLKLFLQNLNPSSQTIMLHFRDAQGGLIESRSLALDFYFRTQTFKFPATAQTAELVGEGRLTALLMEASTKTFLKESPASDIEVNVDEKASYFLLTDLEIKKSFVVKIEDQKMADRARKLIQQGSYQLLFGDIEYAPGSENRSLTEKNPVPFSWHVSKVGNFNDYGSINCDGSPESVEDQILGWLQKKRICFWNYHLHKELTADEVRFGHLNP